MADTVKAIPARLKRVRNRVRCAALLVMCAVACGGETRPGSPAAPSSVPAGEPFEVSGVVTNETGMPLPDVPVTMRYSLRGFFRTASAITDAAGRYTTSFTATPMSVTSGRLVARAEVVGVGGATEYDWYYRSLYSTAKVLQEDFRLQRIRRVVAGASAVVPIGPENGDCLGWLTGPCGRFRVLMPTAGDLTVDAVLEPETAARPEIQVCCVGGDERSGNPVTIPVAAGTEVWVEVGRARGEATGSVARVQTTVHVP